MGPLARLFQLVLGPSGDDVVLVRDVVAEHVLEREDPRHAVDQGDHDHAKGALHRGVLVELVERHLGDGFALELDDDAHARAVGLVSKIGDLGNTLIVDEFGDLLDHLSLVHLVRDLGDDDRGLALLELLGVDFCAHHYLAPAGLVGLFHPCPAHDDAPGGEIRALDVLRQIERAQLGVVDKRDGGVDSLAQVVRGDIGRHAHGDARRAVYQQVRVARREHHRLFPALVVVGGPVDRVGVDVPKHLRGQLGQAALGVAHGRGGVTVDGAKIAVSIDQGVADGEALRHPHQSVVDSRVTVRVEATHDVPDDAGALAVRTVGLHAGVVHAVEDTPVHRLEAVPGVGESPTHDHAHGVIQVGVLHLLRDLYLFDTTFESF